MIENSRLSESLVLVGQNIKKIRKKLKLSQVQFSEKVNVDLRHIQRIEAGQIDFRFSTLYKLARTLRVSYCDLTRGIQCTEIGTEKEIPLCEAMRNHFNIVPIGINVCNKNGLTLYVNTAYVDLTKFDSPEDMINKVYAWETLYDERNHAGAKAYMDGLIKERPKPTPFNNVYAPKSGQMPVPVKVYWNYLLSYEDKVLGFTSVVVER